VFGDVDVARLLGDAGIVRNRQKIAALIANAGTIQELRRLHGSFSGWLAAYHPLPIEEWTRLFRRTFRFTGGLIVGEFLMSLGYLPGAHEPDCPVYPRVLALTPPWSRIAGTTLPSSLRA
jgi:DNA-3-methyladenine glycosylase I